ncbi:MAG: hypothetical protein ACK5QX_08630, partial [bacterium]
MHGHELVISTPAHDGAEFAEARVDVAAGELLGCELVEPGSDLVPVDLRRFAGAACEGLEAVEHGPIVLMLARVRAVAASVVALGVGVPVVQHVAKRRAPMRRDVHGAARALQVAARLGQAGGGRLTRPTVVLYETASCRARWYLHNLQQAPGVTPGPGASSFSAQVGGSQRLTVSARSADQPKRARGLEPLTYSLEGWSVLEFEACRRCRRWW